MYVSSLHLLLEVSPILRAVVGLDHGEGESPVPLGCKHRLGSQGYNFQAGSNQNEVITSQISLVFNENTVNERRETFVVPLRTIGELLPVKSFNY